MTNLMRVYNICVQSPIENENNRPQSLCVAALLQSEPPQFSNAAASRL